MYPTNYAIRRRIRARNKARLYQVLAALLFIAALLYAGTNDATNYFATH